MTTSGETLPDLLHHDFAPPRATVIIDQENFHKLTPGIVPGFVPGDRVGVSTGAYGRMLADVADRDAGNVFNLLGGQFRVDRQGERFPGRRLRLR